MANDNEFAAILRERATKLSRPLAEPVTDLKRVVIFSVGRELYGLEIGMVVEILRPEIVTFVPGAESHIEGVTNLRGDIVTVIDLEGLLTGTSRSAGRTKKEMIVGEFAGNKLGMLVTNVDGIHDIQAELIDPPLTTIEKLKAEYLLGEFKFGNRIVGLLNAAGILEIKGA